MDASSGAAPASSTSTQPIMEEIGVPSWCAVSFAMPTQIERRSLCRIERTPKYAKATSNPAMPICRYGITRSCRTSGDSP